MSASEDVMLEDMTMDQVSDWLEDKGFGYLVDKFKGSSTSLLICTQVWITCTLM